MKVLRQSLSQNLEDVKGVLDRFEASHSEAERNESTEYGILVDCQFALEETVERIGSKPRIENDRLSTQEKQAEIFNSKKKEDKSIGRFSDFEREG